MVDTPQLEAPKTQEEDELAGSEAPLLEHLIELRKRLIYCSIALVVLTIGCFIFAEPIYHALLEPYRRALPPDGQVNMIFTAPQELFFTYLNVALFGAIFLGFPVLAYQVYGFVAPGLYKKERKAFLPYLIATPVFFVAGAAMVYWIVLPMVMHFFLGMQTEEITLMPKASEYLSMAMTLIIAFGICFQLPVILTLLAQIEVVDVEALKKGRRYAIVGILAVAAFITPPDPISQIGLAVPMYLLYEAGILSVRWVERSRKARDASQATE